MNSHGNNLKNIDRLKEEKDIKKDKETIFNSMRNVQESRKYWFQISNFLNS